MSRVHGTLDLAHVLIYEGDVLFIGPAENSTRVTGVAATAPDAARRHGQSVVVAPECRHARARRPTGDVTG